MTDNTDNRILAFHGLDNTKISSVGQVQVDLSCIKGVTTVETVEEPILIDVTTIEEPVSETPTDVTYYIIAGCVGFVLLLALIVTLVMCKLKKGCFSNDNKVDVNTTQTMPMENFAGYQNGNGDSDVKAQSFKSRVSVKRASMKRPSNVKMSEIEHHVIESQNESADLEDSDRKNKFKIDDESIVNGTAPQMTDDGIENNKFSS